MRKALLASTALVGAALLSAPAQAGTVGSGDNLAVTLSGFMWFQMSILDEDNQTGHGRGYKFKIPETEWKISAFNTADNGIKYGVIMELETNTDAGTVGDEIYAQLSGDFGTVQLGDNDSATNTMLVGAFQAHKGLSGPFGGLGGLAPVFHLAQLIPASTQILARTDWQNTTTTDSTKVIYFSPRFSGFQLGASWTPDSGSHGASFGERDDDGDFENVFDIGLNYTQKFDDFGISISGLYQHADDEPNSVADSPGAKASAALGITKLANKGGTTVEDLDVWYIGAKVDFAGFTVGANYSDYGDTHLTSAATAAGQDAGDYWAVAVGYQQGPWGISAWYSYGERDWGSDGSPSGTEESIERFGIGGRYAIAPGWQIRADYNYIEHENIKGSSGSTTSSPFTTNEAQAFILTNMFNF